ncbi:ParA family protein [Metabacillus niabensis]|uniref:ParA family protein n=1 Tax=Metabacillus niabensis TaxID=324854 RepID=UPI00399FB494
MGFVITNSLQKGGVAKTTGTGMLSYLMSRDGYKVLAIDMDSQGNLTELLTGRASNEFKDKSVLEAMVYREPKKYIVPVMDNLDVLPANNFLALFSRWLYTGDLFGEEIPVHGGVIRQLSNILLDLREEYDFIMIDTPPSLSEQTTNALVASDYVLVPYECSYFCYQAIPNFFETVEIAQNASPYGCEILGIIRTLSDKRRSDAKLFNDKIAEDFPDLVFETIITRRASIGRLAFYGFEDNEELDDAIKQYQPVYKEIIQRLGLNK